MSSSTRRRLGHAITKEDEVPDQDIERAIRRKHAFEKEPEAHTFKEEGECGEDN